MRTLLTLRCALELIPTLSASGEKAELGKAPLELIPFIFNSLSLLRLCLPDTTNMLVVQF